MQYDVNLDCWIIITDLPCHVKGLIRANPDGTVTMLINQSLSDEARAKTYEHERQHILRGDLYNARKASEIEMAL